MPNFVIYSYQTCFIDSKIELSYVSHFLPKHECLLNIVMNAEILCVMPTGAEVYGQIVKVLIVEEYQQELAG